MNPAWIPGLNCTGYRLGDDWIGFVSWPPAGSPIRWTFNPDDTSGSAASAEEGKSLVERKWADR